MQIREANLGDAAGIAAVQVETWRVAYRGQVADAVLDTMSVEYRTRRWSQILGVMEPPRSVTIVADDGAGVVGFADIGPSRDTDGAADVGELNSLYLLPRHWDTGVGRRLIEEAEARLIRAGFASATLWVLDSNARGRRFYEAAGWTADGTTQATQIGEELVPEIRYRKGLGASPAR
jgi:ribosomal protein S18 acetylase RimI-like enzyme